MNLQQLGLGSMGLESFALGQPLTLLAMLALLPAAGAWWYATRRTRRSDTAYGGAATLHRGRSARRTRIRGVLLLAAMALIVLGMARPQWGRADTPLERRGIDVALVLDISRSMQAPDVVPSRAEAAAAGLRDMLLHLHGDRVGLVTFGGSAFKRSPLTLDLPAMSELVTRAQRESALVRPGTDIGQAINIALQVLNVPDRAQTQVIVLISDGEDLGATAHEAVTSANAADVHIYTVAAGTEQGAPVPPAEGARPGTAAVVSRADRAALARIASETGGSTRDVKAVAGLAVEFSRLRQSAFDRERQPAPIERFQWVLGIGIALLVAQSLIAPASASDERASRRSEQPSRGAASAITAILVALLLTSCSGTPAYRAVADGNAAYARGDLAAALAAYQQAKTLAPDNPTIDYNLGNALQRLDRLDEATTASKAAVSRATDAETIRYAMYALGNHAVRRDALTEARDAYVTVLQRDPDDADARHNLELVLRALQPSARKPQPTPTPPPSPPSGQGGTSTPPPPGTPPGAQPSPSGSPQPGTAGQPTSTPAGGDAANEDAARRALVEALRQLDDGVVTPEQALAILERARLASEAGRLARPPGAQDPNDR